MLLSGDDFLEKNYSPRGVLLSLSKAVLYFGLWLCMQIVVVNLVALVLSWSFPGADEYKLTEMMDSLSLEINIMIGALTVIAAALIAKLFRSTLSDTAEIKKYPGGFTFTLIIMGIATAYAISLVFGLLEQAGAFPDSWVKTQSSAYTDVYLASPFMQFLSVGFVAPVMEEILFRGCILSTLKKEMHPWIAIVISAALFAVAHGTPIGIMYAFILGLIMGWLAVTFKSIVPTILFHMAYNCTLAYSGGISLGIAILSLPILAFEIISIKNYFRGNKE